MKRLIGIWLLIYFALNCGASRHNFYFERISPESGFSFDAINTISEDNNGFVWFGCSNGLYFSNTASVKKINLFPEAIRTSQSIKINKAYHDSFYTLWVCSENGLFYKKSSEKGFTQLLLYSQDTLFNNRSNVIDLLQYNNDTYLLNIEGRLFYFKNTDTTLTPVTFNSSTIFSISYLGKDLKGELLIGTSQGQIFTGNNPADVLQPFYKSVELPVRVICEANNKLYVGFDGAGVEAINLQGKKIFGFNAELNTKFHIPDNRVRDIIKLKNGEIWIATYEGIQVITSEKSIRLTSAKNSGLPHSSVYVLHKGKNEGIWAGTWAGGLAYYHPSNYRFRHIVKVPNEVTEPQSAITSFTQDIDGNLWVASEQVGINVFDPATEEFLPNRPKFNQHEMNKVKTVISDEDGNIYMGTFHQGLWYYNNSNKQLQKLHNPYVEGDVIISSCLKDGNDLWLGTRNTVQNIIKHDLANNQVKAYTLKPVNNAPNNPRIWKLLMDSSQKLWACTNVGLFAKNKDEDAFYACFENDSVYGLSETMIYTILEDSSGDIWIGTKGKGLFKFTDSTNELAPFSIDAQMSQIDVYALVEDHNHNIWFSCNKGVFRFNRETNTCDQFSHHDGISGYQFNPNAVFVSKSGEVFFGSSNGFCYIQPNIIQPNTNVPEIYLSKFLINNKSIENKNNQEVNIVPVNIKNIKLKHFNNTLTFGVVTNNFIKPAKNKFRYRLLNYQDEWQDIDFNQDITFTKVPPGSYIFEVLGANQDNIWSQVPLSINIEIEPPLWQKWYAILFYIALGATLIGISFREVHLRITLRNAVLAERYQNETNKQVFEEKLRFFTNISHEIRTPLSLILSPLNNLLSKFNFDEQTVKHLHVIQRNASRLLRISNQILDFRLLETNKLKARMQNTDIIKICNEVYNCFEYTASEKQISFLFFSNYKSLFVPIDPDMVEKIIYNLISNAIKFSHEKGQVFLSVESKEITKSDYNNYIFAGNEFYGKTIEIKVRDFGRGIKPQLLNSVLDPFAMAAQDKEISSGIGLHMCREYAMLNGGNILVTSSEGKGSTFILNIPFNKDCEYLETDTVVQYLLHDGNGMSEADLPIHEGLKRVVVLAEENNELRTYLKDSLNKYYQVLTAKNGRQAYDIACEVIPDIIITDILMPVMDGIELIKKMKQNTGTSGIPIIVLTALHDSKYHKDSLLSGVDSYLTKPVDESLLLAQIENLLFKKETSRKQLKDKNEELKAESKAEKSLIDLAEKLVENNLKNSDFYIASLLDELHVSRSTFHRKIKQATNQSPSEFIRDIRLKNAVKLMRSGKYNIDEIGTFVGFNSTSYFIRSFKKKYGKTPKDFYKKVIMQKNLAENV